MTLDRRLLISGSLGLLLSAVFLIPSSLSMLLPDLSLYAMYLLPSAACAYALGASLSSIGMKRFARITGLSDCAEFYALSMALAPIGALILSASTVMLGHSLAHTQALALPWQELEVNLLEAVRWSLLLAWLYASHPALASGWVLIILSAYFYYRSFRILGAPGLGKAMLVGVVIFLTIHVVFFALFWPAMVAGPIILLAVYAIQLKTSLGLQYPSRL